jgi:protoporphyrinogen oxidase
MPAWRRVTCVQWAAESSPLKGEPILWLNGTGAGLVNNVAVPSDVAEGYAPKGKSVVSVTVLDNQADVLGDEVLVAELREELAGYFGEEARGWRALAVQRIHRALPVLRVPNDGRAPLRTPAGLWVCGDHVASASIEGAMASGQAVADALVGKPRI